MQLPPLVLLSTENSDSPIRLGVAVRESSSRRRGVKVAFTILEADGRPMLHKGRPVQLPEFRLECN